MCRQRFSRSMIHDLERELTLGCICADVVDTKVCTLQGNKILNLNFCYYKNFPLTLMNDVVGDCYSCAGTETKVTS